MVPFYFEIFHSMPFNSAFMSNFELATKLWYSFIAETTIFSLRSVKLLMNNLFKASNHLQC